jgi:hypothetical protein
MMKNLINHTLLIFLLIITFSISSETINAQSCSCNETFFPSNAHSQSYTVPGCGTYTVYWYECGGIARINNITYTGGLCPFAYANAMLKFTAANPQYAIIQFEAECARFVAGQTAGEGSAPGGTSSFNLVFCSVPDGLCCEMDANTFGMASFLSMPEACDGSTANYSMTQCFKVCHP